MKKTIKKAMWATIFAACTAQMSYAQWNNGLLPDIRTTPTTRSVGIGNFTLINRPLAALHLNANLMATSPNFTPGHVFRTDGANTYENIWEMWSGTTQKIKLFNPENSNSFVLQSSSGDMRFNVQGANERMIINTTNHTNQGLVRIGATDGVGPVLSNPANASLALLVVGSTQIGGGGMGTGGGMLDENQHNFSTVAEFRNSFDLRSSTGIKIRSSRVLLSQFCNSFVEFANYDNNLPGGAAEYPTARMCGSMQNSDERSGYFQIQTNDGDASTSNISGKFMIDRQGLTGVGTAFGPAGAANAFNLPHAWLEVSQNSPDFPQLRLTYTYNTDAAQGLFTDITTTANGDLFINPRNGVNNRFVGINTNAPTRALDVEGNARFRTLPNDVRNNISNVVVADVFGNLFVRDAATLGGGGGFGTCGVSPTSLTVNSGIELAGFNFVYSGAGRVGIGTGCSPLAKLEVNTVSTTNHFNIAVLGVAITNTDSPIDVVNTGVYGYASTQDPEGYAHAGFFDAVGVNPQNTYAIFSNRGRNFSNSGNAWEVGSDERLKTNIVEYNDGLNVIMQLTPKQFEYNGKANTTSGISYIGLIAQEVQPVAPYLVGTYKAKLDTTDTEETVLYSMEKESPIVYALINAVKEQQAEIESLKNIISSFPPGWSNGNIVAPNTNNASKAYNVQQISLNVEQPILYQNTPNPFGNQTSIAYYLPESITSAQMVFYDSYGKIIKTAEITQKGHGRIDIDTATLANGAYSYSLITNGKVSETKKMIRAQE